LWYKCDTFFPGFFDEYKVQNISINFKYKSLHIFVLLPFFNILHPCSKKVLDRPQTFGIHDHDWILDFAGENVPSNRKCDSIFVKSQISRWSSLQNMKSTGRSQIQIQLLPPYIYLNLQLHPLIHKPTPKPTQLHPSDLVYCNEVLLQLSPKHIPNVEIELLKAPTHYKLIRSILRPTLPF